LKSWQDKSKPWGIFLVKNAAQALERTAARRAFTFQLIKTLSAFH
jgi:hypothetical protein